MNTHRKLVMLGAAVLAALAFQAFSSAPGLTAHAQNADNARTLAPYFTPATSEAKSPDADGFLQRWLLLEPITNGLRSNAGFNETFIRETMNEKTSPGDLTAVPKDGETVTVDGKQLAWHALDSSRFNVKLYRFAYGLDKTTYGVLFWAVTVVDSPREMKNVRLAVGSNSASMWWLNGEEVVHLFGDRRMVQDDVLSPRLTLKKGRNVLRAAIINGPGMSDFCARFVDEQGNPIKDLKLDLTASAN